MVALTTTAADNSEVVARAALETPVGRIVVLADAERVRRLSWSTAEVRDAAMLASAQAVEHYEITRYGTLIAWSKQLGRDDVVPVGAVEQG